MREIWLITNPKNTYFPQVFGHGSRDMKDHTFTNLARGRKVSGLPKTNVSTGASRRSRSMLGLGLAALAVLTLQVPNAVASFLPASSSGIVPTAYGFGGLPGTFITELLPIPVVFAPGYSGLLNSMVILDTGTGFLDFLYQVTNDATSTDALNQLRVAEYAGIGSVPGGAGVLDVGFIDGVTLLQAGIIGAPAKPVGTKDPTTFDRNASGNRVTGNFDGADLIGAGDVSSWLVIRTNAPASMIAFGTGSVVDDLQSNLVPVLAPIPEPTTGILGLALTLICAGSRTRASRLRS